jgi:pimeloyl-ACP methyl ester carboxylesterase
MWQHLGMAPKISYAKSDGVHIAYAVVGDGPIDIVFVPGFASSLDLALDNLDGEYGFGTSIQRLARFGRVVLFDKRGTGLSDRSVGMPGLETRMDDVRAVMDAAGTERAALIGMSEGGPMSLLFAATFPERTQSLTIIGSFASFIRTDDHPWMPTLEDRAQVRGLIEEHWGTGRVLATFLPPGTVTPELADELANYERRSASPSAVVQLLEMNDEIDVRAILPTIGVPTLIVHAKDDATVPFECGRYLAEHIPDARFVARSGAHMATGPDALDHYDDIEEFITGVRPAEFSERVLSTVLFSDIVGSTDRAAELGDDAWRKLLDRHDDIATREITRFRGLPVKHTGDGVLARFDGPARAVACGIAMRDALQPMGLSVRTGVHTGEIELRGDDIGGIGVHVGARIMALAGPDEVLVSRTVRDLTAGSNLSFADRGEHELKGVPERWQVFAATN